MAEELDLQQFAGKRVLCVVAHMDDEALLCGGTLLRLRDLGCDLTIAVAASVETTNRPRTPQYDEGSESLRRRRRTVAWQKSCAQLGALPREWNLPNLPPDWTDSLEMAYAVRIDMIADEFEKLQGLVGPDMILTHGQAGEYGHTMHRAVHRAVGCANMAPQLLTFAAQGRYTVPIDWMEKQQLLEHYRVGTTQRPTWEPLKEPAYAPWCRPVESFD